MSQNLYYFDVVILLPYPRGKTELRYKYPATTTKDFLKWLEEKSHSINDIHQINQFEVTVQTGRTLVRYKLVKKYAFSSLEMAINIYKQNR